MFGSNEKWADIDGYNGRYQISNLGRIRSTDCQITQKTRWGYNAPRSLRGRLMTPTDNGNGYLIVGLKKDAKRHSHYVHRLVAEAFCIKPEGCDVVDHIDRNKHNNAADNLRWCTQKENIANADLRKPKRTGKPSATGEKYIYLRNHRYRLSLAGKIDRSFDTLAEAVAAREVILNGGQYHAVE